MIGQSFANSKILTKIDLKDRVKKGSEEVQDLQRLGKSEEANKKAREVSRLSSMLFHSIGICHVGEEKYYLSHDERLCGGGIGDWFFPSSSVRKMLEQAEQVAQTTIRVGGEETRATVRVFGEESKSIIEESGKQAKSVVGKGGDEARKTLTALGNEAKSILTSTHQTTDIMRLQIEQILNKAGREVEVSLLTAGHQAKGIIRTSGQEMRETVGVINVGFEQNIQRAGNETRESLVVCGRQAKEILQTAGLEAKELLINAGGEASKVLEKVEALITKAIADVSTHLDKTIEKIGRESQELVSHAAKELTGVVLTIGDQGKLLIREAGNEVRVTADEVLSKAFAGQAIIIKTAGEEARLTIQSAAQEVRCVMYELPALAGQTTEQAARGLGFGLKDTLLSIPERDKIIHKLEQFFLTPQVDVSKSVSYVKDQTLDAKSKVALYKVLLMGANKPGLIEEDRKKLLCYIGIEAMNDDSLKVEQAGLFQTVNLDLSMDVINSIPSQEVQNLLYEHGTAAMAYLCPSPKIINISPFLYENPLTFELEQKNIENLIQENNTREQAEQFEIEKFKMQNEIHLLKIENTSRQTEYFKIKAQIEQREMELQEKIRQLDHENSSLKRRLENSTQK
ncbi:MAG: hypothetical protein V4591_09195 [Bdellovibrionota bacterium]